MNYKKPFAYFRQRTKGHKVQGFKTTYGYLFCSEDGLSLEVYRDIKRATVFRGNVILCG